MSETRSPREAVKKVENATLFDDGTIVVRNVICSHPHVFKKWAQKPTDTPAYSCGAYLPKATHQAARDLIAGEIEKIIKANPKLGELPSDARCLKNGDRKDDEGRFVRKPEERGNWTLATRDAARRPVVVGPDKSNWSMNEEMHKRIYGGCIINLRFRLWAQNNDYGKKVNGGIVGVQFVKDGTPFGEGHIAEEVVLDGFDLLEDDDDGI
jgi:hypothetical protein